MSTASSILYYLGLNSIEDEVSRLNLASKSQQRNASNGHTPTGEAGSASTAECEFVHGSNETRSRSYSSQDGNSKRATDGAAIVDNDSGVPAGKNASVSQNNSATGKSYEELREEIKPKSKTSSDSRQHFNLKQGNRGGKNCNSCGSSGAKACCGGCRAVFYVRFYFPFKKCCNLVVAILF